MINIINYYYGINIIDVQKNEDKIFFNYNSNKYFFVEYDRDSKDLKNILDICNELKRRNILTNELIINKFNTYFTPYNGLIYVLIKDNQNNHKIDLNDIFYFQNNSINIFDNNRFKMNYIILWKNKIDFYEKIYKKISNKNKLIHKTFDYYIGLGENAIAYLVNNEPKNNNIVLSHRRLSEKKDSFDFYNPLNYILDNRARDIADYIKVLFFYENISSEGIISLFKYINFSRDEYLILIARLLFPTYYFDLIDNIVFNSSDEMIIKGIINKTDDYINLLKNIFYYLNYNLKMNIPVIDWIIKT